MLSILSGTCIIIIVLVSHWLLNLSHCMLTFVPIPLFTDNFLMHQHTLLYVFWLIPILITSSQNYALLRMEVH